jgi:Uma2 family endonuclease
MSNLARLDRTLAPPMSVGAFEQFLAGQAEPHPYELVGGVVVAMANPTETHNQIVNNINAPLKLAMDKRRCRTYASDMRVQRTGQASDADQYRPDVVVRCGPHTGKTFITDPLVVVEVLSPTTMDIDRGPKLEFYQSLQTTCHIALVYQDQIRVEHYRRTDTGWERQVLTVADAELVFDAVAFRMPLSQVYFDLDV